MRPFRWRDILTLIRHRNEILFLDYTLLMTRGNPLGPAAVLAHLYPEHGNYIGVSSLDRSEPVLIGQMHHEPGDQTAQLTYMLPRSACVTPAAHSLVEGMAELAGQVGAMYLLAEVEDKSAELAALRRAGFSVYARQRIWKLDGAEFENNRDAAQDRWQPVRPEDGIPLKELFHELVPPLAQRIDPIRLASYQGFVYRYRGDLLAYVYGVYGPNGILLQPLVHPGVENAVDLIRCLPYHFMPLLGRPVYLAVRSFQAWLENPLRDLNALPGEQQALLVRHLAQVQRTALEMARLQMLESPHAETTATIVRQAVRDQSFGMDG